MKKMPLLLAAIVSTWLATGPSLAADFDDGPTSFQTAPSGLTRAEVRAETIRALKAHEVQFGDVYTPSLPAEPARARADVKAETLQALAHHEVTFGDVSPPPIVASASPKTRAEVKAETLVAARNHELQNGDIYEPWKVAEAREAAQLRLATKAAKNAGTATR